jgi:hypothetical protein
MKTALSLTAAFFVIAALSLPAASQSLGDVARQSQASATKKAKVVVTEDDIPPSTAAASTEDTDKKDSDQKDATISAKPDSNVLPKEPTKENVAVLKNKIDDLKSKQQEYQLSVAQLEEKLQNPGSDFRARMYREALENNQHSLKVFTEQRDAAEKALSAMEQQMKKSGEGNTAEGN